MSTVQLSDSLRKAETSYMSKNAESGLTLQLYRLIFKGAFDSTLCLNAKMQK